MHWVFPGFVEPLSLIPGHCDVQGIERYSLLKSGMVPGRSFHIAAHVVNADLKTADDFRYTQPHSHDFDEMSILTSEKGTLTYLFEVDGQRFTVSSPATILIPAHAEHRMEAISGEGTFLCVHLDSGRAKGDG